MPLEIRESNLPGVGKKYEVDLDSHQSVAVIIHSNGRREVFYRDDREGTDYQEVLNLSDSQARILGLFLVGAYYQPIATKLGQQSDDGEYVDWYSVDENSTLVGLQKKEIYSESDFDGIVLGVERDSEVRSTVDDEFIFDVGDRLIVIGADSAHQKLSEFAYES